MAGINVERATTTLSDSSFLMSAAAIVGGSLFAQVLTNYMKQNVRDIQQPGGDAVYATAAAFVALTVLPALFGRPIALGSSATGVRVLLSDFGVV